MMGARLGSLPQAVYSRCELPESPGCFHQPGDFCVGKEVTVKPEQASSVGRKDTVCGARRHVRVNILIAGTTNRERLMDMIGQRLVTAGLIMALPAVVIVLLTCIKKRSVAAARVREMKTRDKADLLDSLLSPFGYFYYAQQDLVLTRIDAWQRMFGYKTLYDRAAAAGGMIFQCFPVYFDYAGKTWLLEFWKGQYGITSGCEIGLYHADRMVAREDYARTYFESASDEEMQNFTIILEGKNMEGFAYRKKHWWLAAFRVGEFHLPEQLQVTYQIRFQSQRMLQAVWNGLERAGYPEEQRFVLCSTLVIRQNSEDAMHRSAFGKVYARWVLFKNCCLVKLFRGYTAPFTSALDRILFLYFRMPSMFRRVFLRSVKGHYGRKHHGGTGYGLSKKTEPGV